MAAQQSCKTRRLCSLDCYIALPLSDAHLDKFLSLNNWQHSHYAEKHKHPERFTLLGVIMANPGTTAREQPSADHAWHIAWPTVQHIHVCNVLSQCSYSTANMQCQQQCCFCLICKALPTYWATLSGQLCFRAHFIAGYNAQLWLVLLPLK